MSCPHTDTTAVLAAFGEAPDTFNNHLQDCSACRTVVQQHTDTLAVLDGARTPPVHQRDRRWPAWTAGALLAAAALLAISTGGSTPEPAHHSAASPSTVLVPSPVQTALPFQSSLDSDLSNLELELALLDLE